MSIDIESLPENPQLLKEIVFSLVGTLEEKEEENERYEEQIRYLLDKLYGRKSEKLTVENQLTFFDEAEESVESSPEEEKTVAISYSRRKRGRKPLPVELPRVEVVHDLDESEKICGCGVELSRIGEEVSEKLDIVPASIRVIRHVRPKYACKSCEGVESDGPTVKIAPVPPSIIPQGIATAGLLAHTMVSKFSDALPFYRQERLFERIGVDIGRGTMSSWAIQIGKRCEPLIDLIWKEIRSGPLINMDETTVQVMKEPGRADTSKSYMWVMRGGEVESPVLLFQYEPTRSGAVPQKYLSDYNGYLQTDGYKGYDALGERAGIIHLGCWAHARRKFMESLKSGPKRDKRKKKSHAEVGLDYIGRLYGIEKECDENEVSYEDRQIARRERAAPILDEFRKWLGETLLKTPPRGLLGKAVSYTLNQWERLTRYTQDGRLRPDNNLAENAIRPFVVGRKNWMFSGSPRGATASATIYSLIETAKANGLEPYRYLCYLFERLPHAKTEEDYKALLPPYIDRQTLDNALTLKKTGWG